MIIKHSQDTPMNYYFDAQNQPNKKVQMGKLILQPGERRPKEGVGCHEQDEYSYVIKGSAHSVVGKQEEDFIGNAGDAQLIPAGECHYNYNDSDEPAEIVWILVER